MDFKRIVASLLLLLPSSAFAKFSPETDWKTAESGHFRIHYPASYQNFANSLGFYLEKAYAVLSQDLGWSLDSAAEIVVNGDTDFPNGLTSVYPLNRIVINAVPFGPETSIGEYDDWIRTLAYHELTHLVANDTTRGIFAMGRSIFGSASKINQYQPQWIVEGLAVYEETLRSQAGRGRSAYADMVFRTAAQEGLLERSDTLLGVTLDRLNDGPPIWPGPTAAYLYGYLLQEVIAEISGDASPGKASYLSSGTLPFFINRVAEETSGSDFYNLWNLAVAKLKTAAQAD